MTAMRDELRQLGARLWPDDSSLAPRAGTAGVGARRARWWRAAAVAAGTAVIVFAVLAVSVAVERSRTSVSRGPQAPARWAVEASHSRGHGSVTSLSSLRGATLWGWGGGIVVRSDDELATVHDVTPAGVDAAHPVVALTALDSRRAWAVARGGTGGEWWIYRTRDAGSTWSRASLESPGDVEGATFVDGEHGWLLTAAQSPDHRSLHASLLRTADGGGSWSAVHQRDELLTVQPGAQVGDCHMGVPRFTTATDGIAGLTCDRAGAPELDITHDGGATWRRSSLPPPSFVPRGVPLFSTAERPVFASPSDGSVFASVCAGDGRSCVSYGALYRTADGGATWTPGLAVRAGGHPAVLADPLHGWLPHGCTGACGGVPVLLVTDDGGLRWSQRPLPPELAPTLHGRREFHLVSPSDGVVIASGAVAPAPGALPRYLRTRDGGATFVPFHPQLAEP